MMKKIIQIFFLFLIIFLAISCQKESIELELTIDEEQKVITVEKNGIEIEFCLLNEQGEPATVFKEGEDFTFHLAIINNIKSYEAVYMPLCNGCGYGYIPDEFYVMTSNGDTIGRPFFFRGAVYMLFDCPVIKKGESFVLDIPWTENRDNWPICTLYAHGSKNTPLEKGIYYTSFTHKFCFRDASLHGSGKPEEYVCTDNVSFKINFEIK